jgi:hypothetical protein
MAKPQMPKAKTKKSTSSKSKSTLSPKVTMAILVSIIALAGLAIVYYSFAGSLLLPNQYSYTDSCPQKTTSINVKTNKVVTTSGPDVVTVPYDPTSDCVKNSAEAMAYRLYYVTFGKQTDIDSYKVNTQKMAGDRIKPQLIYNENLYSTGQYTGTNLRGYINKLFNTATGVQNPSYQAVEDWAKKAERNNSRASDNLSRRSLAVLFAGSPNARRYYAGKFVGFIAANPAPVKVVTVAVDAQRARANLAKEQLNKIKILNDQIQTLKSTSRNTSNQTVKNELYRQANVKLSESKTLLSIIRSEASQSAELTAYAKDIDDQSVKQSKNSANSYYNESNAAVQSIN